jgi:hypothetical protein
MFIKQQLNDFGWPSVLQISQFCFAPTRPSPGFWKLWLGWIWRSEASTSTLEQRYFLPIGSDLFRFVDGRICISNYNMDISHWLHERGKLDSNWQEATSVPLQAWGISFYTTMSLSSPTTTRCPIGRSDSSQTYL